MKNVNIDGLLKELKIDNEIIKKLESVNINTIKDLWVLNKKQLKELNFNDNEINHIRIKMQLWGLDLNKKIYT